MEFKDMKTILKKEWDRFLVNPVSVLAPLTKITKKIRNRIINTDTQTRSINNQLILFLSFYVNKPSYFGEVHLWNF